MGSALRLDTAGGRALLIGPSSPQQRSRAAEQMERRRLMRGRGRQRERSECLPAQAGGGRMGLMQLVWMRSGQQAWRRTDWPGSRATNSLPAADWPGGGLHARPSETPADPLLCAPVVQQQAGGPACLLAGLRARTVPT
jgi:hypothetical protein